jgi:hypothetical protein
MMSLPLNSPNTAGFGRNVARAGLLTAQCRENSLRGRKRKYAGVWFCDENSLQNTARRAVFSARRNRRPFCVVSDWLKSAPEFSVKIEAKASVSRQSDV